MITLSPYLNPKSTPYLWHILPYFSQTAIITKSIWVGIYNSWIISDTILDNFDRASGSEHYI